MLTTRSRLEGGAIHLELVGDASENELTGEVFASVHAEAMRLVVPEVIVDVRELEFMNASSFKCVVSWVAEIQALESDKQYRVRFLSNPNLDWQRRSLRSLSYLATDLIVVETQAA